MPLPNWFDMLFFVRDTLKICQPPPLSNFVYWVIFIVWGFIFRFISFSFIRFKKSFYHFWFLEFFTYQKAWFWIFRTRNQTKILWSDMKMSNYTWRHCSKCWKISYVNWAVLYWVCFEDLNFIPIYLFLVKIGFLLTSLSSRVLKAFKFSQGTI